MANGNNPQPQQAAVTWQQVVMAVAGLLIASVPTWIVSCNAQQSAKQAAGHAQAASVQSAENAGKIDTNHADSVKHIDAVKDAADTAAVSAQEAKVVAKEQGKKIDAVKSAVEKK